jgi:hypothetical protein
MRGQSFLVCGSAEEYLIEELFGFFVTQFLFEYIGGDTAFFNQAIGVFHSDALLFGSFFFGEQGEGFAVFQIYMEAVYQHGNQILVRFAVTTLVRGDGEQMLIPGRCGFDILQMPSTAQFGATLNLVF